MSANSSLQSQQQSPRSRTTTTTTTLILYYLCSFLILSPVSFVSTTPVVPLAVAVVSFAEASPSLASNATTNSNSLSNSTRPIAAAPVATVAAAATDPDQQQQQHPPQTQAPNNTMYGSEEQPAVDNHQAAPGKQQQPQPLTSASGAPVQQQPPQPPQQMSHRDPIYMWSSLAAGVGSGALASMLCAPLDLVRTRMQVWGQVVRSANANGANIVSPKSLSLRGMLRDIIQRDGWRGCFRGLGATLVTVPTFWGVYFPLYDDFKRHWTSRYPETNPVWIHMGSAVMAGGISDVICNPMFVVRTRLQTEALHQIVEGGAAASAASGGRRPVTTGMIQTAKSLYSEGGPLVFWRGMTANLMGLSHAAIQFPVYEQLKKTFRHDKEQESAIDLLLASGLSKMTASMISYPHEVIRSRMMDARAGSIGFVQTCRTIYTQEGMVGFYAGLPVSLVRVIPNTCITFLTYELILRYARTKIREHRDNGN